jgi:hypothetical protein
MQLKTARTYRPRRFLGLTTAVLLVYLCVFSAVSVFSLHVHVTADGRLVAHCHPVSADDRQSHQHTSREFLQLDHAVKPEGIAPDLSVDCPCPEDRPPMTLTLQAEQAPGSATLPSWSDRAPPQSLLS